MRQSRDAPLMAFIIIFDSKISAIFEGEDIKLSDMKIMKQINFYQMLLLLSAMMMTFSCGSTKKTTATTEKVNTAPTDKERVLTQDTKLACDHGATILSKLDQDINCALLIELPNGTLYQPIGTPDPNFLFTSGDKVRVSYEILSNYEISCTQAQSVVKLTCLEKDLNLTSNEGNKCVNTIDAFSVSWMHRVIQEMDPERITKYDYNGRYAYGFENRKGEVIFDCTGVELCRKIPSEDDYCAPLRNALSNSQVILVINN